VLIELTEHHAELGLTVLGLLVLIALLAVFFGADSRIDEVGRRKLSS
jgi:hypothetical protein